MPTTTTLTEADMRPGERLVAGRVYVFNAELLGDHLAREAVANAPSNLSRLSESDLALLGYRAGRVWALERGAPGKHTDVSREVTAERARRGLDSAGAPLRASKARAA